MRLRSRLNAELGQIMKQPDVQEKYKYTGLGLFTAHSAPQDVLELAKRETTQMAKILKAAGITPE